jgi:hypothetical protein
VKLQEILSTIKFELVELEVFHLLIATTYYTTNTVRSEIVGLQRLSSFPQQMVNYKLLLARTE